MYLDKGTFDTYWANTSANSLVGKLIREGDKGIKTEFEKLLSGGSVTTKIDEQIVFSQLSQTSNAVYSLPNRESGFGRYDVVMDPKNAADRAVIMEFKVHDTEDGESNLEDTARHALEQIEEKQYAADLLQRGIPKEHILTYGFAFEGEKCLIRKGIS